MADPAPQPHLSPERLADIKREVEAREAAKWTPLERIGAAASLLPVVGLLILAAIPLQTGGSEPKSSEARAALGTIKDRLRVKFIENKNKVELSWRLSDLVNTAELQGQYYGAADYSMLSLTADSAVFRAASNTNTASPQVTLNVTNIQAGLGTLTSP